MSTLQKVCLCITIVGGINWGVIGLLDFNLVAALFGEASVISRIVYSLVGLTSIINLGILVMDLDERNPR